MDGSGSVNTLLGEVVADARQQSEQLGAVGDAVRAVDQASQQNAALVAQTAGACCTLEMLATDLAQEVARFKTGEPA